MGTILIGPPNAIHIAECSFPFQIRIKVIGDDTSNNDKQGKANYGNTERLTPFSLLMACADSQALDDVHLLEDKVAIIQRPVTVGRSDMTVPALVYTTLLPSCPKLMLNVESDDYAIVEARPCGCPFGALGFNRHVRQIRSYEKLCSEGVTFLGTELLRLVEEVLPAQFGGSLADYQFVEEEEGGLPKVNIVVSPRRGEIDQDRLLATIFQVLRTYPGGEIMAECWRRDTPCV